MVEIKAGPELDLAVAEACGVDGWIESLRNEATGYQSPERFVLGGESETVFWEPSTDLNAAFEAAERVGLFTIERDGPEVHLAKTFDGQWEILTGGSAMGYVSREATPALAICAGILAVSKVVKV